MSLLCAKLNEKRKTGRVNESIEDDRNKGQLFYSLEKRSCSAIPVIYGRALKIFSKVFEFSKWFLADIKF